VPRVERRIDGDGQLVITFGDPLVDDYLAFVAARARKNTLLAADLVDDAVGDSDDVKRVGHTGGMGEVGLEPCPVGLGQVQSSDTHTFAPALRASCAPSAQLGSRFTLEEIDDDPGVEVDERRRVGGRVLRRCRETGGLVDGEGTDGSDSMRIVDEGAAVVGNQGLRRERTTMPRSSLQST
ncbi:MAG: hypothetical protein M0020_05735, partial [Actinomycetota bacterium]|nr:hypothetical protein [Actinomycetota bacterium]